MSNIKYNSNPVKGMRDFTPSEKDIRNFILGEILKTYQKYGFSQIETPVMEDIKHMTSGQGGDNEKMIFKILKRGHKLQDALSNKDINIYEDDLVDYALRFDLTLPLARFYSNNSNNLPNPFKSIQLGYVWRAERHQKGRYRQLMQCDIDIIGDDSTDAESELIYVTSEVLKNIGFKNFTVRINDREILNELVKFCGFSDTDYLKVFIILDKLDKIGIDGVKNELLSTLGNTKKQQITSFITIISKSLDDGFSIRNLQEIISLSKDKLHNIESVFTFLDSVSDEYNVVFDLSLVRGMGYYTGLIFEIESPMFGSSIAGGGRYDNMISNFSKNKNKIPACGFSLGFERIIEIIKDNDLIKIPNKRKIAIIKDQDFKIDKNLCQYQDYLNETFEVVSIFSRQRNFKNQLYLLNKQGFNYYVSYKDQLSLDEIEIKNI